VDEGRRPLRFELLFVVLVSLGVLVPGIWRYSLVDPWETHYGEVSRMMLQQHDWVHMDWPQDGEGFRSKPILQFWMMAASMRAAGVATDGGYPGEMVASSRVMFAIRIPFVLAAIAGLTLMWWMLARLVSRRLAWLALLVVGSCPMFCLISRQAIPDMPLCATVMGAIALFALAIEDGAAPIRSPWPLRLLWLVAGGFVVVQAAYYVWYFTVSPQLAVRFPPPQLVLPVAMLVGLAAQSHVGWGVLRKGLVVLRRWPGAAAVADRLLAVAPLTRMRQVYLLWFYWILGVSILAKGPPGVAVIGLVGVLHVVLQNRWRAVYAGDFELKRGLILTTITFLPWHVAMWLKEGNKFIDEYLFSHIINRAGDGSVDKAYATFEIYTTQLGHGMWLWAALLPAAVVAAFLRARLDTRASRVRFLVTLWAIGGIALFAIVQTKFHHYILPAVPALAILIAFFVDDIVAGRDRLHPLFAAIGVGIVLLICRDLMFEPKRWIEMFTYRYDRPWPATEPWFIDPSDGFLGLGIAGAFAIPMLCWFRRLGALCLGLVGLAICVFALQVYMPLAGQHWGSRDSIASYYAQRSIHGAKLVYHGSGELYDDWHDHGDTWRIETLIPDTLQLGQPMTIAIQVTSAKKEEEIERTIALVGRATAIGDHDVEITLNPGERARLEPLLADGPRGRPPVRVTDADRLIAWILYWRGENFWSGDEIVGPLPEMRTAFKNDDSVAFLKYINDRARAPLGRRYFITSEAGRISSVRALLPTQRARDSFQIIDTTSNKFTMAAFDL